MPYHNLFRHQDYQTPRSEDLVRLIRADRVSDSNQVQQRLANVASRLRQADVAAIYLVHGTFVGNDALGLLRDLARVWPTAGELLSRVHKSTVDRYLGDIGNYSESYSRQMQRQLNVDPSRVEVPVRLFHWSSENHHLGRMEGALQLIEELNQAGIAPGKRVLLWGHSHGGNLFALMTNLLAANEPAREAIFRAARCYYRWPIVDWVDRRVWTRVRDLLDDPQSPIRRLALDLVTFGTPIRYGWDTGGYAKLLHVVHHRPVPGRAPHQAVFPPSVDDVLHARYGDYVQQFGIAGTNLSPGILHWGSLLANFRLGKVVQAGLRSRDLLRFLRCEVRVSQEGPSLLVDYGPQTGTIAEHLAGHAVYTRADWMLFHLEQVLANFYSTAA